jgi:Zn-dependent protease with chaperone function
MPPHADLLQVGVTAIQQKRYADAIQALEAFCHQADSQSKNFFQAQMWLVRAYWENSQPEAAIALCQQMATSSHPQVQAWAQKTLPSLTAAISNQSQTPQDSAPPSNAPEEPAGSDAPPEQPAAEPLSPEQLAELYKTGSKTLKMQRFAEAVAALEAYCNGSDESDKNYAQAQMWLVKAYKGNEQEEAAIALCQQLLNSDKEYVQIWAKQFIQTLAPQMLQAVASESGTSSPAVENADTPTEGAPLPIPTAGRSQRRGVRLIMKGVAASLALASGVTISLLFGMVLVLSLSLMLMVDSENPTLGFVTAIGITIVFNVAVFFISPFIMDLVQDWLYGTRWVSIHDIERCSPESARVIRDVCRQKNLSEPRLGIIEDDNPTAFTYGSLPNSARLVVSRGLFKYLDDDEAATVYAHELGHIVHWDFAVMTLAATLVQITYLLYIYIRELADKLGDSDIEKKIKNGARGTALMAYVFYVIGEYLLLYLSRVREYYADHFAAEVTGNPNGLSRALVKIAYGILEEGKRNPEPNKVIQGTRALGISDPKSAVFTGTAYRVASEPQKVGRVFLWDMFNPWAWWMELSSTHPLTGKRVRALSTYAEQLGLPTEFDMSRVVREGRQLNKQKLYGSFVFDLFLLQAEWIGLAIGLMLGAAVLAIGAGSGKVLLSLGLIGFGIGTLIKTIIMYPDFNRAPATDVLTLMSDPYASPLRGKPVKLEGEVIGRGDAGYRFGSDLKMQDPSGMIYLHYSSRFGPIGNFLFGMTQADSFVNRSVSVVGWFRRGTMPWVDFVQMDCPSKWTVNSYHRFWLLILGAGAIVLGFVLPSIV